MMLSWLPFACLRSIAFACTFWITSFVELAPCVPSTLAWSFPPEVVPPSGGDFLKYLARTKTPAAVMSKGQWRGLHFLSFLFIRARALTICFSSFFFLSQQKYEYPLGLPRHLFGVTPTRETVLHDFCQHRHSVTVIYVHVFIFEHLPSTFSSFWWSRLAARSPFPLFVFPFFLSNL